MLKPTLISGSILAANFAALAEDVKVAIASGIDLLHIDIMDGHFVNNISFGAQVVSNLVKQISPIELDVHLMTELNFEFMQSLLPLAPRNITIHLESSPYVKSALKWIRDNNCLAGLAINPETPISYVKPYLQDLDLLLIMSVDPGRSGQIFKPETLDKILAARDLIQDQSIEIQVDGGIGIANAETILAKGANNLVLGSSLFSQDLAGRRELVNHIKGFNFL